MGKFKSRKMSSRTEMASQTSALRGDSVTASLWLPLSVVFILAVLFTICAKTLFRGLFAIFWRRSNVSRTRVVRTDRDVYPADKLTSEERRLLEMGGALF